MQLELKINSLSIQSILGGATHGHFGLLMMDANYATLSNEPHVRPVHPGLLLILKKSTRVTPCELKRIYNKNPRVFHELHRFKQALIQQIVTAVNENYIGR